MSTSDLRAQCLHIAQTIEGQHWDEIEWEEDREGDAFQYLEGVLDIQYVVASDRKTLLGARLLVAFGGPNIWINTHTKAVEGSWWSESCTVPYHTDALGLEEAVETLFAC